MRKIGLVLCLSLLFVFTAIPAYSTNTPEDDRKYQSQPIVLTPVGVYPVEVDYNLTIAELVRLGNYDYANPHVTDRNYHVKKSGKVSETILLMAVNRWVKNDEILIAMEKESLRPADVKELLAFGIQYPNRQRDDSVILGLGSEWERWGYEGEDMVFYGTYVSFLTGSKTRRGLHAVWTEKWWHGKNLFAVIRK